MPDVELAYLSVLGSEATKPNAKAVHTVLRETSARYAPSHFPKPQVRQAPRQRAAIVTLDGRDFYLGPHGTKASHAEYDRLTGEWLANGRRLPGSGTT